MVSDEMSERVGFALHETHAVTSPTVGIRQDEEAPR